jgi:hypothetical protein
MDPGTLGAALVRRFWARWGKKLGFWLLKQVGGDHVLRWLEAAAKRIADRQRAIKKTREMSDGRLAPTLVEGRSRWVVYNADEPVEIFPPISGDLDSAMRHFDRSRLKRPDEVATSARTRAWVKGRWEDLRARVARGEEDAEPVGQDIVLSQDIVRTDGAPRAEEIRGAAFDSIVKTMPDLLDRLTGAPAKPVAQHDEIPDGPGIYVFSDGPNPRYVGQTQKLRQRLRQHVSPSARENQAALAWRIALKDATVAGHSVAGTRKQMEADERIEPLFRAAKERVANMDVRFIELPDPITRTLLEVYAIEALGTQEFNSFETH